MSGAVSGGLRLDKWLWQARFFKSRTLASGAVQAGGFRLNGERVPKAHHLVREGDVLTFPKADAIRVIKVLKLGTRRGPAPEARELYEDLAPPEPGQRRSHDKTDQVAPRDPGAGRPTKAERRAIDRLRDPFD
ncbi:MAG: RNA-binding S4 domain-containing protein [Magnetovibrionaceae bacterium]